MTFPVGFLCCGLTRLRNSESDAKRLQSKVEPNVANENLVVSIGTIAIGNQKRKALQLLGIAGDKLEAGVGIGL